MEALLKEFMGKMDKRFDQMDKRFDKVEEDIASLKEEVRNNQTENRSYIKFIETKLDEHSQTFQVVTGELKGVKIDITYLNRKRAEHDLSLNNLIQRFYT